MQGLAPMHEHGSDERQRPERRARGASLLERAAALLNRCTARNERLQVCETVSLGGRRSVALIECDGQRFLAGLSANGVETLVPVESVAARGDGR